MDNHHDSHVLFAVTSSDAQCFLIVTSATLALLKSFLALGAYSYVQVALVVLEVVSTGMAFAIFLLFDVMEDVWITPVWNNASLVYCLAFSTTVLMTIMDMGITFQSVRVYKRVKGLVGMRQECLDQTKKFARSKCTAIVICALLLQGIVPIVAYARAGWETDYFAPADLTGITKILVLCSIVLQLISTALLTKQRLCTSTFRNFDSLDVARLLASDRAVRLREANEDTVDLYVLLLRLLGNEKPSTNLWLLGLTSVILSYVALFYVSGVLQAGALCYLSVIYTAQFVAIFVESARHDVWEVTEVLVSAVGQKSEAVSIAREDDAPGNDDTCFLRSASNSHMSSLSPAEFLHGVPVAESRPWDARYSGPIAINNL